MVMSSVGFDVLTSLVEIWLVAQLQAHIGSAVVRLVIDIVER